MGRKKRRPNVLSSAHRTPKNMATAAAAPSGGGVHFAIPEGTSSITQPDPYSGEGHDSWAQWGVNKEEVTSVTIPTSVISIGPWAFVFFDSLARVDIPASVTSIAEGAFEECSSLASVDIPASVRRIEECAFKRCRSLRSVDIPTSVTSIADGAFIGCSSLKSVNIPSSVTSIEQSAFEDCSSLTRVAIPASVTRISNIAFMGCSSLTSVAIPTSVAIIGAAAFFGCHSLNCVEMTTAITTIDECAFTRCGAVALLIKPAGDVTADAEEDDASSGPWSVLAGNVIEDDAHAEAEAPESPPTTIARVWAPDAIIKQLTGPFAAYNTFKDLPRAMRVAPDAKTWAAVELWRWWAAPTHVEQDRLACLGRRRAIFAVMLSADRAERLSLLPRLPEELWLYTSSFLKHVEAPTYV